MPAARKRGGRTGARRRPHTGPARSGGEGADANSDAEQAIPGRGTVAAVATARVGRVRDGDRGAVRRRIGCAAGFRAGQQRVAPAGSRWRRSIRRRCPTGRIRSGRRLWRRRPWRGASGIPAGSRMPPTAGGCRPGFGRGRAWWTATADCGAGTALSGSAPVRARPPSSCASATGLSSWKAKSPRSRTQAQQAGAEAARRRAERETAAAAERAAAGTIARRRGTAGARAPGRGRAVASRPRGGREARGRGRDDRQDRGRSRRTRSADRRGR